MAKNFSDEGTGVLYQNTGAGIIYAGSVVPMAAIIGIALADIPVGESRTVRIVGAWRLPKDTATALAVGDAAYWDTVNKQIVATEGGDAVHAGVVTVDAAASAATVTVKINA